MLSPLVGPFAEAVRATAQPCTVLLIVPTRAAVAAAGARWHSLVAAAGAAVVGGWLLADNRVLLDGAWLRLSGVVAVVLLALLASARLRQVVPRIGPSFEREPVRSSAVGALVLLATMWWRPCVGEELGVILNGAQDGLAGQLLPMAAYVLGALVPVAIVVAARYALDPSSIVLTGAGSFCAAVGVIVAASLVAGQHDEVVVTLTRWTLE